MVLLISYDLNNHERPSSYADVRKVIEENAIASLRPLYSQWFVQTNESSKTWTVRLRQVMDDDDYLFVAQVESPYWGWLPKTTWDWLAGRV